MGMRNLFHYENKPVVRERKHRVMAEEKHFIIRKKKLG
jgi:hypothetical protein